MQAGNVVVSCKNDKWEHVYDEFQLRYSEYSGSEFKLLAHEVSIQVSILKMVQEPPAAKAPLPARAWWTCTAPMVALTLTEVNWGDEECRLHRSARSLSQAQFSPINSWLDLISEFREEELHAGGTRREFHRAWRPTTPLPVTVARTLFRWPQMHGRVLGASEMLFHIMGGSRKTNKPTLIMRLSLNFSNIFFPLSFIRSFNGRQMSVLLGKHRV